MVNTPTFGASHKRVGYTFVSTSRLVSVLNQTRTTSGKAVDFATMHSFVSFMRSSVANRRAKILQG